MSFNSESIKQELRIGIEAMIGMVSGEAAQEATADEMERRIWETMLALGGELMQLFFTKRSEQETKYKEIKAGEEIYPYAEQKTRDYVSIFGPVEVERRYYWQKGKGGKHPLDEALSLPARSYSDWVQEMMGELSVLRPEGEAMRLLKRWFRLGIPKRSAQRVLDEHAEMVEAYYAQRETPEVGESDSILVVTADGKGIPMNRTDSPPPQARRGKGKKKTAKKEAIVTAVYTIAPYLRSSDDVIRALVPRNDTKSASEARPRPTGKQVFGTLEGKAFAMAHLSRQATKRQDDRLVHRIALTDGAIALQQQMEKHLPDYTLILDIIHVTEHLWNAANALWAETDPKRAWWMTDALHCVLEDQLDMLLLHLRNQASYLSKTKQKTLTQVANYLERNRPYLQYQLYLSRGWPIGTGVVEGACRCLVKDRFELTGMRWSRKGAQEMLHLRAVYLNDDWDDFQLFRRQQMHEQRFGSPLPVAFPETIALAPAA
ncbi:MAG: ISKra4 family transposase [Proteobacteria bacterium]|nr:ISKra4 family transposase [Pseudomonadota bacterium]